MAKIQSVIDTMKTAAAGIPPTAKGYKHITQGIDLAQAVLNTYEEATGQTVTASAAPSGCLAALRYSESLAAEDQLVARGTRRGSRR